MKLFNRYLFELEISSTNKLLKLSVVFAAAAGRGTNHRSNVLDKSKLIPCQLNINRCNRWHTIYSSMLVNANEQIQMRVTSCKCNVDVYLYICFADTLQSCLNHFILFLGEKLYFYSGKCIAATLAEWLFSSAYYRAECYGFDPGLGMFTTLSVFLI